MKLVQNGINSIVSITLVIAIGYFGLVNIQVRPIWLLLRSMLLAGLGQDTEGLVIEGEQKTLDCDVKTQRCEWK